MYKELTASQITKDALTLLKSRNCKVIRNNNHATRGRINNATKGVPDIIGHNLSTGVAIYCEVKKIGDKLSQDQIKWMIEAQNCICLIATQGDGYFTQLVDFEEYLNK